MRFFRPIIFLFFFFIFFFVFAEKTEAVLINICGASNCTWYDTSTGVCDQNPGFVSDLSKCQEAMGSAPANTCTGASGGNSPCGWLGPWEWCYATGCNVTRDAGICTFAWSYDYTNCGAYDVCLSQSYLNPGYCGSSGCTYGGTVYKTCCDPGGSVDGNCTVTGSSGYGFDYGTCGSATTVMCGVPAGTCAAICGYSGCYDPTSGVWCTTGACGSSACGILAPSPSPSPSPSPGVSPSPGASPSPPPPDCPPITCSYSEAVDPAVCSSGIQIVTGTGCDGFNCPGCTWVGGCSTTSCYIIEPSPPPPPGDGCYECRYWDPGLCYTWYERSWGGLDCNLCHNNQGPDPTRWQDCRNAWDWDCGGGSGNPPSADCSIRSQCSIASKDLSFCESAFCEPINSYTYPIPAAVGSPVTFTFTSNRGYTGLEFNAGGGAAGCSGPTVNDIPIFDGKSNRWRWTCTAGPVGGPYTARFSQGEQANCPKDITYTVAPLPSPSASPASAWIQVDGDVHSNTGIDTPGGPGP